MRLIRVTRNHVMDEYVIDMDAVVSIMKTYPESNNVTVSLLLANGNYINFDNLSPDKADKVYEDFVKIKSDIGLDNIKLVKF